MIYLWRNGEFRVIELLTGLLGYGSKFGEKVSFQILADNFSQQNAPSLCECTSEDLSRYLEADILEHELDLSLLNSLQVIYVDVGPCGIE